MGHHAPAEPRAASPGRNEPHELFGTVLFSDLPVDEDSETDVFRVRTDPVEFHEALDEVTTPSPFAAPFDAPRSPLVWLGAVVAAAAMAAGCVFFWF